MAGEGSNPPTGDAGNSYEYFNTYFEQNPIPDDIPEDLVGSPPEIASSNQNVPKRKKKSKYWEFFTILYQTNPDNSLVLDPKGNPIAYAAQCKKCANIYKWKTGGGTGTISRHYETCYGRDTIPASQTQINFDGGSTGSNMGTFSYSAARHKTEFTKYLISDELPFTAGESDNLYDYVTSSLNPCFSKVPRGAARKEAIRLFHEKKEALKESFLHVSQIAITSDIWTSKQNYAYICITTHYIDSQWVLQKRIICLKILEFPHTGSIIASAIIEHVREYDIHQKIFSVSFDNASNNTSAISSLQLLFQPILEGRLMHVRCACHIINLVVKECLDYFSSHLDTLRQCLHSLNTSPARQQQFKATCLHFSIRFRRFVKDVPYRWNSTYLMLKSAIPFKDPITYYCNTDLNFEFQVTEDDWEVASSIYDFLETFYNATRTLSGVYYPTSCLALQELCNISFLFSKYRTNHNFAYVVQKMEAKFKKYWGDVPLLYCLSSIFDPRIKLDGVDTLLDDFGQNMNVDVSGIKVEVKATLDRLVIHYEDKAPTPRPTQGPSGSSSSGLVSKLTHAKRILQRKKQRQSSQPTQELSLYLSSYEEEDDSSTHFTILEWWKKHEKRYPVLSMIARDLLMVPVSTVASESCFSSGSRILSKKRSRLLPDILEACVCVQDWVHAEKRTQDKVDESADINELDFESLRIGESSRAVQDE
ncbi:zinc finger BED domain-containing protein RICESLEEPER 2 [Iris pallida]|uniref:Zinc finger BED domain-containing protein RICESLEEPER 2 n=1 Tax=Iris pallida TaxID=29817 RepID=A0AAX6EL82_IRIPA|nr:zinc finger BED domain-containing protein RICESLEEPER 2 [Iris pallida]